MAKKKKMDKLTKVLLTFFGVLFGLFFIILTIAKTSTENELTNLSKINEIHHIKGSGPVSIIEYADLECPACSSYHKFMKSYVENNLGNVTFEYRHFPLTSIHPNAEIMSKYAIAISEISNEQFWGFVDWAYENQKKWTKTSHANVKNLVDSYLITIGTSTEKLSPVMNSEMVKAKLSADYKDVLAAKLRGTPSFVVNGKYIETPYPRVEDWNKIIEENKDESYGN